MTITLLLNSEGKKMGKTEKGADGLILKKLHLMISSSTGEMLMTTMLLSVLKC